jgi:O-methyltransferase involved in polyketide biosynthesis
MIPGSSLAPWSSTSIAHWTAAARALESLPFLPARTRFFDDFLIAAAPAVGQVVVLGAGLDTRPFRLPLPACLRWFENGPTSRSVEPELDPGRSRLES